MVAIGKERLITIQEAADIARVTAHCVYQWANRTKGRRLETVKFGGKRMTSLEALQRFGQDEDTGGSSGVVMQPPAPSDYHQALQGLQERHGF